MSKRQAAHEILFSPRAGPPGSEVKVEINDLLPGSRMAIGFGLLRSGYEILGKAEADSNGTLSLTVQIPSGAEQGKDHYFLLFMADTQQQPLSVSEAFRVTAPKSTLQLEGLRQHRIQALS